MKNIALHYEEYMYVHVCVYMCTFFFFLNFTIALIQVLFQVSLEIITLYYLYIQKRTNV